jgi:hypothetical protein
MFFRQPVAFGFWDCGMPREGIFSHGGIKTRRGVGKIMDSKIIFLGARGGILKKIRSWGV